MDIRSLGLRILFLVRRPVYFRGRRVGRGGFLRRKYRDRTPISATPAVTEKSTTCEREKQLLMSFEWNPRLGAHLCCGRDSKRQNAPSSSSTCRHKALHGLLLSAIRLLKPVGKGVREGGGIVRSLRLDWAGPVMCETLKTRAHWQLLLFSPSSSSSASPSPWPL